MGEVCILSVCECVCLIAHQCRLGAMTNSITCPLPRSILSPPLTCWLVKGLWHTHTRTRPSMRALCTPACFLALGFFLVRGHAHSRYNFLYSGRVSGSECVMRTCV